MLMDSAGQNSNRHTQDDSDVFLFFSISSKKQGPFQRKNYIILVRAILQRFHLCPDLSPCDGDQVVKHNTKGRFQRQRSKCSSE